MLAGIGIGSGIEPLRKGGRNRTNTEFIQTQTSEQARERVLGMS